MQTRQVDPGHTEVFVLWQSLVVDAYRSFFHELAALGTGRIALASPAEFCELGGQRVFVAPFAPPFTSVSPSTSASSLTNNPGSTAFPAFTLRTLVLHTQIVVFWGLGRALQCFFKKASSSGAMSGATSSATPASKRIFLCIAEPYSPTALFAWIAARLRLGRNFVFILYTAQNIYKDLPWPLRYLQAFLLKRCTGILTLGAEHEAVVRRHGYRGPCLRFPLWFDSRRFALRADAMAPTEADETRPLVVGFAGSLVPAKGIMDLMTAWTALEPLWQKRLVLRIVGAGPLAGEVDEHCQRLRALGWDALYLGPLPAASMAGFFQSLDLLVIPSRTMPNWKEQFGRVIVEAQACGVLVLGSDSGEIPQVIADQRWVFKEGDMVAMQQVLMRAWQSLGTAHERQEWRQRLAATALQCYSDQALAQRFAGQLEDLTKQLARS